MPLKIFVADGGHRDRRQWCIDHEVGLLMSPEYATIPPPGATFMLDNGAFTAWKHHEEWDEKAFYRMLTRFYDAGLHPYGVVIPDIVKGGLNSLKRSEEHQPGVILLWWAGADFRQHHASLYPRTPAGVPA